MLRIYSFLLFSILPVLGLSQNENLRQLKAQLAEIRLAEQNILQQIERVELSELKNQLLPYLPPLLPGETLIEHELMALVYSETHEQAKWVGHVISPKIITGSINRTNDFRVDPKIAGGSAQEADYFLKYLQNDSTYTYDGFGYDRGHLAPSADFRWSGIALSESYYYSNMSPQLPDFNRGVWAGLENTLRSYVYRHPNSELIVFTGPLLRSDLEYIERSVNQVSIPKAYWKVALDVKNQRAIGFILPHKPTKRGLKNFIRPVDSIEYYTGIDFFPNISPSIEAKVDPRIWLEEKQLALVEPMDPTKLPRNHFNTTQARRYMGQKDEVQVCGTVVSGRLTRSKNVMMNLDRPYPDEVFNIFIRKDKLINFASDPLKTWLNQKVCVMGKVASLSGTPTVFIDQDTQLKYYQK